MKLIPHHQDDKYGPREYRSPDGTWRVVRTRPSGGSRNPRPRWEVHERCEDRAGGWHHHAAFERRRDALVFLDTNGRDAGKRERHDSAPPAAGRASRNRWRGRRTRNRPPASAERIECVMTMERDRRCDAGAADNREPPPALGRRTLEVANLASTDMTVMGRHANGRARLDCSRRPGRGRRTGRRGQTEHRNSSSAFELCGPPGAATHSGRRARAVPPAGFPPKNRVAEGGACSSSIVADLTPLPALPVAGGRETHCPEGADAPSAPRASATPQAVTAKPGSRGIPLGIPRLLPRGLAKRARLLLRPTYPACGAAPWRRAYARRSSSLSSSGGTSL